jgi:DNA-binding FadR family transcriptional regulator
MASANRQSVADTVYIALRDQILSGTLQPGDALPGERRLSESLGVNRGAVREGLRRLAHARLITVTHGGATRVLDYRDAGLDLLGELLLVEGAVGVQFALDILELREALSPLITRCAAERGGATAADALRPVAARIAEATDHAARYAEVRVFWKLMGQHAGNLALRLALNSLQQGTGARTQATIMLLRSELTNLDAYHALVDAIAKKDGARAAQIATDLVRPTLALARQLSGSSTAS